MEEAASKRRGRPCGKRTGHGWSRRPATSAAKRAVMLESSFEACTADGSVGEQMPECVGELHSACERVDENIDSPLQPQSQLELIARALWMPDYSELFEAEIADNTKEFAAGALELPPSSHRQRLQGERAAEYDRRRRTQQRDQMAIARHCMQTTNVIGRRRCWRAR